MAWLDYVSKRLLLSTIFRATVHSAADYAEFLECIDDLLADEAVQSMQNYTQHRGTSILEHSLFVSYLSFKACKKRGYDYRSAARGGLLHDFFLYQRHVNKPYRGWHTTGHPRLALQNATERFALNNIEKDIIVKHMWPLCINRPRYKESFIVSAFDKYCCTMEFFSLIKNNKAQAIWNQFAAQAS